MGKKEQFRFSWERAMTLQPDLQPTTKHVLLTLAVFMDEKAICFPSTRVLAQRTGLSRYSVCVHLEKANKAGWIEKTLAGYNGKGWRRHKYLAVIPDKVGKEVVHDSDEVGKDVAHDMPEGGQPNTQGRQPGGFKVGKEVALITISNTPKNTTIFSQNSDELRLSELLYALLVKINPRHKKPNLQKWAKHIDLAIRIDKRLPEELEGVMRWALADSFWQSNIQSTEKLRKQFDQLIIKMRNNNNLTPYMEFINDGTSIQNTGKPTADTGKYDGVPELVVEN